MIAVFVCSDGHLQELNQPINQYPLFNHVMQVTTMHTTIKQAVTLYVYMCLGYSNQISTNTQHHLIESILNVLYCTFHT